ncbi:MAG: hypothetical protein LH465_08220 [Sphingomonas bacterium]|nr:hypothetical protein [Sphingomonas bacterium]
MMPRPPNYPWMTRALFALAMVSLGTSSAFAQSSGFDVFSPDTVTLAGNGRLVGVDGERSWLDDGFGKLAYGGRDEGEPGDFRIRPRFGEAALIWQPRFGWALSGTVVGIAQRKGDHIEAGLSEAFVGFKPLSGGSIKLSARAGLMWPPVSLEHSGPEWAVTETITPSAINSWIGEEVKVVGLESSLLATRGRHKITATAALFDVNDTAGALLSFRGWGLHDVKALAFHTQPLPEPNEFIEYVQPRFTHPVKEMDGGFLKRPGFYAKLAWQPPFPVRIEALHYDNNSDPESVNDALEWGWRTKFNNFGLVADLGAKTQLRAQAIRGRTRMGITDNGAIWVDNRFRSAFALVTQRFGISSITGRIEAFGTRNKGGELVSDDDEHGWAVTLAGRHPLGEYATVLVEALHVSSRREAREREGMAPRQDQNQIQAQLRLRW